MANKIMVSLFDYSTVMAKPWFAAGYDCYCVDTKHEAGPPVKYLDVLSEGTLTLVHGRIGEPYPWDDWTQLIKRADFVAAFPPCTDLATSGARWFKDKGMQVLINALQLVEHTRVLCEEVTNAPYLIENPVGMLSTYWRKPDYKFNPYDYAGYLEDPSTESYPKNTCLWTGNGFIMPPKKEVEPTGVRKGQPSEWHSKVGGKSEKAKAHRSKTPEGFARAVFEVNHK